MKASVDELIDRAWIRASAKAGKCLACGKAIPPTERNLYSEREDWMLAHLRESEVMRRKCGESSPKLQPLESAGA